MVYAFILYFRLVPKLKSVYVFNVASILDFGSVVMTFIGVNYYLSKGIYSYGSGDTPVFPIWAWVMILVIVILVIWVGVKQKLSEEE